MIPALLLLALQPPTVPDYTVRGWVLEPGLRQPLAEAEVALEELPATGPLVFSAVKPHPIIRQAKTDFGGAFSLDAGKPGRYRVVARKAEYAPLTGPSSRGLDATAIVSLTRESPSAELKLFLARPGALAGRLLDADTDAALPNVVVSCMETYYWRGRRTPMPAGSGKTDAEGRFQCLGLPPGEYVAWVRSQRSLADTYLPGGPERENAIPIGLPSGASLSFGNLAVRRAAHYQARIKVDCPSGVEVEVEARAASAMWTVGRTPCGRELVAPGLAPGEWRINAYSMAGPPPTHVTGSVSVMVKDKDIEVALTAAPGMVVQGRVAAAEASRLPPLADMEVRRICDTHVNVLSEVMEGKLDAKGTFRLSNLADTSYRLMLPWLPPSHYVKEMRYNGVAQPWPRFTPNPYAASHTLEIVLDDKPASLSGTVMDGRRRAPQARVWLVPAGGGHEEAQYQDGNEKGAFRFDGLAPGEYRVLAVESPAEQRLHAPGGLERALANAKTVTLGPRAGQTVTIELLP